jgi:hypothetical protein
LASFEQEDDRSTLAELAATGLIIAGALAGMYAFYAYWITS